MYWTILSLVTTAENYTYFAISYLPFYSWLRLGLHLWLVAPGSQGATALYQQHLHPLLSEYEHDIDDFISTAHEKAKKAGLEYAQLAIEYIKVNVLGMQPKPPTPPPSRGATYAQTLLSRFSMPAAGQGLANAVAAAPATGDFYGLLSSALQSATGGKGNLHNMTREAAVEDLNASGTLIPNNISSHAEKLDYVSKQREGLRTLLQAFDREATFLSGAERDQGHEGELRSRGAPAADLTKSRSEVDFEKIESDEAKESAAAPKLPGRTASSSWMPWGWAAKGQEAPKGKTE